METEEKGSEQPRDWSGKPSRARRVQAGHVKQSKELQPLIGDNSCQETVAGGDGAG